MSDKPASPPYSDVREKLQEKILENNERLEENSEFEFSCQPGVSCFNKCCGDVNIFLSPYDVFRMKKRLGMTSGEFLQKHTILLAHKELKTPVVILKMNHDEDKTCPCLTDKGCGIYSDRPWPCRMYPVGMAARRDTPDGFRGERFYFLLKEEGCRGFEESPKKWTIREWMDNQQVDEWDFWGEAYKELAVHEFFEKGGTLTAKQMHMFFTACYDLDKFREFVFGSTLLHRFDVDADFVDDMQRDEEALLRFAFLWLRFSLFGEKTMKVRPDVLEAFQKEADKV